ncbi:hypothetical protein GCM10017612_37610 [Novosphingobium resinovorum]|nr:hypothetical protein GCM10017612_37610 [Novosphingobium resinovorum]
MQHDRPAYRETAAIEIALDFQEQRFRLAPRPEKVGVKIVRDLVVDGMPGRVERLGDELAAEASPGGSGYGRSAEQVVVDPFQRELPREAVNQVVVRVMSGQIKHGHAIAEWR